MLSAKCLVPGASATNSTPQEPARVSPEDSAASGLEDPASRPLEDPTAKLLRTRHRQFLMDLALVPNRPCQRRLDRTSCVSSEDPRSACKDPASSVREGLGCGSSQGTLSSESGGPGCDSSWETRHRQFPPFGLHNTCYPTQWECQGNPACGRFVRVFVWRAP